MDSVSQAVLGATVAATFAPKAYRRKALLLGAALGTLPDMDVIIDYGDAVSNFTQHRGFSHSLLVLAPFSILLWLALKHLWPAINKAPIRWLLAISLSLITHPLLDAHTAYGTQLFWPFEPNPQMWSTLFIIDPLFTLPMLTGVVLLAFWPEQTKGIRALHAGLLLSSLYLSWSWFAQLQVNHQVDQTLQSMEIKNAEYFASPTPFNTLLWRIVVKTDQGFLEGFDSLLIDEPEILFTPITTDLTVLDASQHLPAVKRLQWFASGYVKASVDNNRLVLSDLRMGSHPVYVFSHVVADKQNGQWQAVEPERLSVSYDTDLLQALWRRIWHCC